MRPLQLSDSQLALVRRAAALLQPKVRPQFLQLIAHELADVDPVDDGAVAPGDRAGARRRVGADESEKASTRPVGRCPTACASAADAHADLRLEPVREQVDRGGLRVVLPDSNVMVLDSATALPRFGGAFLLTANLPRPLAVPPRRPDSST
jgi:hypothetical protein